VTRRSDAIGTVAAPVLGLMAFFGAWELIVRLLDIKVFVLPPPSRILNHLADDPGFYVEASWVTAREATAGFALALLVGVAVGSVMARSRRLERAILPIAVLVQVTPVIAYAPAFVIWLGFGLKPIIVVTALVCVVPFVLNTVTGLRSVDPAALEVLESVAAKEWEIFARLRLPSALPHLFAAARTAVGLALIGAVLGEWFANGDGLGRAIKQAQARPALLFDQIWGSIFVLGFLGGAVTVALSVLERRVLRWHTSNR
jgi:NitT/TauT family transport system permease protein